MKDAKRGFTLVEVLIATMLLIVGLVGSIALIGGLVLTNRSAHSRDVAYELLQQTLDQEMMVPLNLMPNLGLANQFDVANNSSVATVPNGPLILVSGTPGSPMCFASADDVVADRPVNCAVSGLPAAFILRTWTCCATAGDGTSPGGAPYGIPANSCGPSQTADILPGDGVGGVGTWDPRKSQGTICLLQAEVSWPVESQPTGGPLVQILGTGPAKNLFQEVDSIDGLSFANHAYASVVREQ